MDTRIFGHGYQNFRTWIPEFPDMNIRISGHARQNFGHGCQAVGRGVNAFAARGAQVAKRSPALFSETQVVHPSSGKPVGARAAVPEGRLVSMSGTHVRESPKIFQRKKRTDQLSIG